MNAAKASIKLFGVALLIIWIIVIQTPILWFTRGPKSYFFTRLYHIATCKLIGLKFDVVGTPARDHQTLYVSNHMSFLDISAIGSVIKEASFIAKKEAQTMPVYGYLSTMQQTAFVSRDRKDVTKEKNALDNMIAEGKSLILFPEGTTTYGDTVLPFKSSLFGIVLKDSVKDKMAVQAITISLLEVNNESVTSHEHRKQYAWTPEESDDLTAHLWQFLKGSGARLRIEFHSPVMARDFKDRKELAKAMQEKTTTGLVLTENNPDSGLDSNAKAA